MMNALYTTYWIGYMFPFLMFYIFLFRSHLSSSYSHILWKWFLRWYVAGLISISSTYVTYSATSLSMSFFLTSALLFATIAVYAPRSTKCFNTSSHISSAPIMNILFFKKLFGYHDGKSNDYRTHRYFSIAYGVLVCTLYVLPSNRGTLAWHVFVLWHTFL